MKLASAFALILPSIILLSTPALAAWPQDGVPVCAAPSDQFFQVMVPDNAGGAIIVWQDLRGPNPADIYAQRVNNQGVAQWATDGVAVCNATAGQENPYVVSDGSGGVIITWQDSRSGNYDIYAQRINASGTPQWAANGVPVCTNTFAQQFPRITADGSGGAVIAWMDFRSVVAFDVYAQRINSAGTALWTANGVAVCMAPQAQTDVRVATDGAGGAFVAWTDMRTGSADIYAQRLNASGVPQWTADGLALCAAASDQIVPSMISDGAGGAIVAWQDFRNGASSDIYATRVNSAGVAQWVSNGLPVCLAVNGQLSVQLASDGANGAILTWTDLRGGSAYDIYAQRVSGTGNQRWTGDGVALCTALNPQTDPSIVADGVGGAVIAWDDNRAGGVQFDTYAQRVDAQGTVQWAANGAPLSLAAYSQAAPVVVLDGTGGVIAAFEDHRNNNNSDIYAQRLELTYGYWGHPEPVVTTVADIPHDQGGKVKVNWTASGRDLPVPATIDFYSVWRAVDATPFVANGSSPANVIAPSDVRIDTPPGKRTRIQASSYYWELVGTQTAYRQPGYSFSAETRADSVLGASNNAVFMVMAHDRTDSHIAFASNTLSGHSVDNLAPVPPLMLTAQRVGNYVYLKWNGVHVRDLRDYAVYRQTSSGVTPIPVNFLSSSPDTLLTDSNPPAGAAYYIVTAYDVHANQSAPSNEAAVGPATGAGNLPPVTALTVLQNRPNPFAGTASIELGLPAASQVSLEVFDVAGRRVAEHAFGTETAGWHSLALDAAGADGKPLASGVYFYRITAAGETLTRKMVIAR